MSSSADGQAAISRSNHLPAKKAFERSAGLCLAPLPRVRSRDDGLPGNCHLSLLTRRPRSPVTSVPAETLQTELPGHP